MTVYIVMVSPLLSMSVSVACCAMDVVNLILLKEKLPVEYRFTKVHVESEV